MGGAGLIMWVLINPLLDHFRSRFGVIVIQELWERHQERVFVPPGPVKLPHVYWMLNMQSNYWS